MELLTQETELMGSIMDEYETLMNTVLIGTKWNPHFNVYIPSPFEVLGAFEKWDRLPDEDAVFVVIEMAHRHNIFFRFQKEMMYVPVSEVW